MKLEDKYMTKSVKLLLHNKDTIFLFNFGIIDY